METKSKDTGKTKDVLRQLQSELRQLQTTVNALQKAEPAAGGDSDPAPGRERGGKQDWAVQYAVIHRTEGGTPLKTGILSYSEAQILGVSDEAVAALGYAASSPQKVSLLRSLLLRGTESAAALGEAAQLSTGSLYHHLHDLMHAGLIGQSARNRYALTDKGRRVLLVLLALASQP